MMPEAPVRFSTMNCCLSASLSFAARMRASGSTEPPGGYGETNLTTLVGHSCACSGAATVKATSATKNRDRPRFVVLERHISSSLELQHVARIVGRGDRQAELFQNTARLLHLLGVGFCELAAPEPQAIFQTDAHVAAHHRAHRGDEHLVAPGAEHRPVIRVAEQAIGGALHVQHVLRMRPDAAADAEDGLDEQRWFKQATLKKMRRGIKMADVVALDLEAGVVVAAALEDVGD